MNQLIQALAVWWKSFWSSSRLNMELSSLVDVDAAPISSTPAGSTATRSSSSSSAPAVSTDLPSLSAILASINAAASALAVPELQLTLDKPSWHVRHYYPVSSGAEFRFSGVHVASEFHSHFRFSCSSSPNSLARFSCSSSLKSPNNLSRF